MCVNAQKMGQNRTLTHFLCICMCDVHFFFCNFWSILCIFNAHRWSTLHHVNVQLLWRSRMKRMKWCRFRFSNRLVWTCLYNWCPSNANVICVVVWTWHIFLLINKRVTWIWRCKNSLLDKSTSLEGSTGNMQPHWRWVLVTCNLTEGEYW